MARTKKTEEEKQVQKSNDILSSFLKQNSQDHYNFEKEIDYKVSGGSLQLDLRLGGGLGPGLHRFCGMNEGGKEQPVSEPVLTPDGWVKIGDLKIGDAVIDSNGKPQKVLGVFPQGVKDVYNVTFDDGSKVRCGIEHLWETSSFQERHNGGRKSVKSLQYIKETLRYGSHLNHSVKIVKPVDFSPKELPIQPYLLGAILGDGGITESILISNIDQEVWDGIEKDLKSTDRYQGYKMSHTDKSLITKRISFPNIPNNPIKDDLVSLGLFGLRSEEKFIPEIYKFASKEQRMQLIRGLIDTDGYVNSKKSEVLYYSTSEKLVDDVIDIARSLGCLARKRFKKTSYIQVDGTRKICKDCFVASLHFPEGEIPCTIKRKVNAFSYRKINFCHFIKDVELVGQEESVCIKVSSVDSLYVTKDYVLTHNTSAALSFMKNFLDNIPKAKGFYIKAEGRLSKEMMSRSGVKFVFSAEEWEEGTCFVFESNIYETVVDAMRELVSRNEENNKYYFLLDSVDGLISKGDLHKNFEDSNKVAGGAVIAANFMKRLSIALAKRGHMAVFISQVRADIKLDPYSKAPVRQTTATGGNALLHFANWILEFEPRHKGDLILKNPSEKTIDPVSNPIIGHYAKVTVKKSPNETTNLTIVYPIKYGRTGGNSVWVEKEIVDLLFLWEFITKKTSWISSTEEFDELLIENGFEAFGQVQGQEALFNKIESNKALSSFLISYFKKAICNEI
jgi:RecA/RadA recombinase